MSPGPETRALSKHQIERLEAFRRARHDGAPHGYSAAQLRLAMGAQFGWRTLQKALHGRPVRVLYHAYIVEWLDRFLPVAPLARSGKDAAAGDGGQEENGESEAARTVRGSR